MLSDGGDIVAAMIQANVTYYSDAIGMPPGSCRGEALGDDIDEIGDLVARFSKGVEPIIRRFVSTLVFGPFDLICVYNMLYHFNDADRDDLLGRARGILRPEACWRW